MWGGGGVRDSHMSKGKILSGNKDNKLAFGNILPILVFCLHYFPLIRSIYPGLTEYL